MLLVGAQLVRLVGEGIDECVSGGLDGCRLRIVDVVFGVHGQVFLDRIVDQVEVCLLYTSPSPRDMRRSRMPSSA